MEKPSNGSVVKIPTIRTSRLVLRALDEADAKPMHEIFCGEAFIRYLPNPEPPPLDRLERVIAGQRRHWAEHGHGWWGLELAGHGEFIGWSGLQFIQETQQTEVAFFVKRELWGQGYATEAGMAALAFGFETHDLPTIIALVHPENKASRRVIEKLGMRLVDELQLWGMDLLRYSLARERRDPPAGDRQR